MMPAPEVSILIRAHNVEKFLYEAIESVRMQDFQNWEALILDDASDDATPLIAQRAARTDAKIRHIRHTIRRGRAQNANDGIAHARGTFIAVLDGDDLWTDPTHLNRQINLLRHDPQVVLVAGGVVTVDECNMHIMMTYPHLEQNDDQLRARLLIDNPIPHSTAVYRRDTAVALGGYSTSVQYTEDYDLWLKMGMHGRLHKLEGIMSRYRTHGASITVQQRSRQILEEFGLAWKYRKHYPYFSVAILTRIIPWLGSMLPHHLQNILRNLTGYHNRKVQYIDALVSSRQSLAPVGISVVRIPSLSQLTPEQAQSWEDCVADNSHGTIFQTLPWVRTWWECFGEDKELFILAVVESNGKFQAIFPGMITHERWLWKKMRILSFIGAPLNDVGDVPHYPYNPAALTALAKAVAGARTEWDAIRLQEFPSTSPFLRELKSACVESFLSTLPTTIRLRITREDKPISEIISSHARYDLNNKMNKLQQQGKVNIILECADADVHSMLDIFYRMHLIRSRDTTFRSPFYDLTLCNFYHKLLDACQGKHMVRISCMTLNGTPIVIKYRFEMRDTYLLFLTTFDSEYQQYSPAIILTSKIIEKFLNSPALHFDFGRGDELYKRRFAKELIENVEFVSSKHFGYVAIIKIMTMLKVLLKRSKKIQRFGRQVRKWSYRLRPRDLMKVFAHAIL